MPLEFNDSSFPSVVAVKFENEKLWAIEKHIGTKGGLKSQ